MSMNNRKNIMESNMEDNVGSAGQGAKVNENDDQNYNITLEMPETKKIEAGSKSSSPDTEENMNKDSNKGKDISDNNSSLEGFPILQDNNKTIRNNSELASNGGSVELDNQIAYNNEGEPNVAGKNKSLENSEQKMIVCDMVGDMCVMKLVANNENNSKKSSENNPSAKQDRIQENSEIKQNNSTLSSNNEKSSERPEHSSKNKISIDITADSSKMSEVNGVDRSSEMLAKKVTKLNISPQVNKTKETFSKVVVNRQSDSLKSLMAYDGDSDSEHSDSDPQAAVCDVSSEDEANNTNTKKTWRKNEDNGSGTNDSESDSSASTLSLESDSDEENSECDSGSVIDASDDGITRIDNSAVLTKNSDKDKGAVKKKNPNILDLEEFFPPLPDLSKLNLNLDEADFMHIGRVSAVISELVTVTANPGTPAFDLDSMLFIDDQTSKKPIGPIFDVLGQVAEPIYVIRFNSEKEVQDMGVKGGIKVYAVPKSDELTKFVFVQELMKIKGSDASWFNDHETPVDLTEYSDDEKEREAKRAKKASTKRKLDDGSLERHQRYERTMNQCNTLNTRVCRLMDSHKNLSKHIRPTPREDVKPPPGWPDLPAIPPQFDPTVPPPGFAPTSPYSSNLQHFTSSPGFGQSPNFTSFLSPYGSGTSSPYGPPSEGSEVLLGGHYAGEPPLPQNLFPPPGHWTWANPQEPFRRPPRSNNPRSNQHNSDNYFTNNSRNSRGAGPSSQPF